MARRLPSDGSEVGLFEGESREHQRTDTSVRVHGQATVSAEEASLLGHVGEALSQEGRASPMDTMTAAYGGVVMLSNRVEDESTWVMKRTMPMGMSNERGTCTTWATSASRTV